MRRILQVVVVAVLALATSCASDVQSAEPDALALVAEDALTDLDELDRALVELEASWICDAQRRSSPDPGVVDEARAQALAASDVTIDEYTAFRADLEARVELRQAVLARFTAICDAP